MPRVLPLALLLVALAPAAISAEPAPEDVVKYRHSLFHTMGAQLMDIGMITKGKAGTSADLLGHAIVLNETAKIVGHAFPKGTGQAEVADSRALPKIWDDAAAFDAAWKLLVTESGELVKIAKRKDVEGVGVQLGKVGAACGGCHESFRGPEPEEEKEHHE
jgi:cytochrome c556